MKPENTFIKSIHKHLTCWHEKMCNPYRRGTPDVYYSGMEGDLWVEYKYVMVPSRGHVKVELSALQKAWIRERRAEGRNVVVIVGCKAGGRVYETETYWDVPIPVGMFNKHMKTRKELANYIMYNVGDRACLTSLAGGQPISQATSTR